jgi:hypothetical protein
MEHQNKGKDNNTLVGIAVQSVQIKPTQEREGKRIAGAKPAKTNALCLVVF